MENSIISCTGSDCTICSVLSTVSGGINFLMAISAATAVLILVIAGLAYIFTIGRQRFLEKAKIFARGGIIGFMLVVTSWLIIRTLFFVSGYQDAASWWHFSCETQQETTAYDIQTDSLESLKTYPDVAAFLTSGEKKGRISMANSTALANIAAQLNDLKSGEELLFYLPAKNNTNNSDAQIPFLAGYKSSNGRLNVDQQTTELLEKLVENVSNGDFSLLGTGGAVLSQKASTTLTNYLISLLWDTVISNLSKSGGLSNDLIEQLKSAGSGGVGDKISAMTSALSGLQQSNDSLGSTATSGLIADLTNQVLKNAELVARKTENNSIASNGKEKSSGDRSEKSEKDKEDKWKDTQQAQKEKLKKDPDYNNLPSTKGENPVGDPDKIDDILDPDKKDGDKKTCDYKPAKGDPVKEALIRIECKDPLRYNMIHRFVKKISNTDFPGGFCEDCGEIAVNFKFPRQLLDQLIIHESTHAGQFCLGIINMSQPQKVEREACANQMGSLCREKHDENEGKGTDDYLMQEITCKESQKICPRQYPPHIEYRTSAAGTGEEEVRGYLSRWHVLANPSGDLNCQAYDWPVKYAKGPHGPQGQSDSSNGPYHYGAHACGEERVLGLYQDENNHVKSIVKSQEGCRSKSLPELPKAKECEDSGASPIEIDQTPKSPPGM